MQASPHVGACASTRLEAFARTLVRDALAALEGDGGARDGLVARAERLAAHVAPRDDAWARRLATLDRRSAALGCVLWTGAYALGVGGVGWRHERRALEHVLTAVLDAPRHARHGPTWRGACVRDLPDLVARTGAPRAELAAFEAGFWLERHLVLGARTFSFERIANALVLRCERGGDACPELEARARASTRHGAWFRLDNVRFAD